MFEAELNVINEAPVLTIGNETSQLIIDEEANKIQLISSDTALVVTEDDLRLLSVAIQGPEGPQGEQGEQGIQGIQGPPGDPGPPGGGLEEVQDDPSPELGGDLILGSYNIIGQLENGDLIIDGGLI